MTALRVAALILAVMPVTLVGQRQKPVRLSVTVVDPWGARLPTAIVEFQNQSAPVGQSIRVDSNGEAIVDIPPSATMIRISAQGFETDVISDVQELINSGLKLRATLSPGRAYSGGPVMSLPIPDLEAVPISELIAPQPIHNFEPLPNRRLKKR